MFCENCGKKIDPKYNVCMYCGTVITQEEDNATQFGNENIEKLFEKEFAKLNTVQSEAPVKVPVQQNPTQPEIPVQRPVQNNPHQQMNIAPTVKKPPHKKANSKKIILSIVASIVVIILLVVSFLLGNITANKPGSINLSGERPSYIPEDAVEFNGNYYKAYDELEYTWQNAKAYCESQGGHLATITSAKENEFIISLATKGAYHLGAWDSEVEGEWKWITGEKWNYANWFTGEPNNLGDQDYLQIYGFDSNESAFWDDFNGYKQSFICEWEG